MNIVILIWAAHHFPVLLMQQCWKTQVWPSLPATKLGQVRQSEVERNSAGLFVTSNGGTQRSEWDLEISVIKQPKVNKGSWKIWNIYWWIDVDLFWRFSLTIEIDIAYYINKIPSSYFSLSSFLFIFGSSISGSSKFLTALNPSVMIGARLKYFLLFSLQNISSNLHSTQHGRQEWHQHEWNVDCEIHYTWINPTIY